MPSMSNHQLSPVALLSVLLAGGLALRALPEPFGWLQTLAGVALLIVLFAYDTDDRRTIFQSVAFSTVCGFCLMLAVGSFITNRVAQPGATNIAVPGGWLSVVWVVGAVGFFFLDLVRSGSRAVTQQTFAVAPTASRFGMAPTAAAPSAAPAGPRAPAYEAPAERYAPPEPYVPAAVPEPPEAALVQPETASIQPNNPVAAGPPPKQAIIYVNLLDEGINMMRAIAAQDLGRGYYLIVEPMPEGENWQFQPGQVVRCEKKKLASGKHLVAVAEAPRA